MTAYENYIFSFWNIYAQSFVSKFLPCGEGKIISTSLLFGGSKLNEYSIASDKGLAISIIPGSPPNGLSSICLDLPKPNLRRSTISIFTNIFFNRFIYHPLFSKC